MKRKPAKKKTVTASYLKKKCDNLYSQYIRQKYADKNGYAQCYTCPINKPWKEMQNGHFVSRQHLSLRWDDRNCRVQCVGCNVWQQGRGDVFATNLVKELGVGILEELQKEKRKIRPMGAFEYRILLEEIENKVENLLENKET